MYRLVVLFAVVLVPPGAAAAAEHVVAMKDGAYAPDRVRAKAGDTIRFVNGDTVDHEVFVPTVGFAVDLGKQEPGKEAVLRLGKAGSFEAECVFHQNMLLEVEVAP
ncbi:cupredoxin domain-containing protein [Geminicoccaceae bacterium 1502E]|nr:cupredoxin domain-containing protein [Geminicoccaceae bacterium 1502E]